MAVRILVKKLQYAEASGPNPAYVQTTRSLSMTAKAERLLSR